MMTIQQKMYETTVKAVGGRNGYIESESPKLNLTISTPREMGGGKLVKVLILNNYLQLATPLVLTVP